MTVDDAQRIADRRASRRAHYLANRDRIRAANKAWQDANRARMSASHKAWYATNRETVSTEAKAWREANPELHRGRAKAWRKANPDKLKAQTETWRKANPGRAAARNKAWRDANPEHAAEHSRTWRKANPGARRALGAAYRAGLKKATPAWADRAEIRKIYERAVVLGMQVDHIHPLRGKNFCGLHVPWNLQLLTARDNRAKGNRLFVD